MVYTRRLLLLLFLVGSITLVGCSNSSEASTSTDKSQITATSVVMDEISEVSSVELSSVKEAVEERSEAHDEKNDDIDYLISREKCISQDGNYNYVVEDIFGESGNKIMTICYDSDLNVSSVTKYDEEGHEIERVYYSIDNRYLYMYDTEGRKMQEIRCENSHDTWSHSDYEYDENGNLLKIIFYSEDSSDASRWTEFEYIEGKLVKEVDYSFGNVMSEIAYEENKKICKYYSWDGTGSIRSWSESEYDERGNVINICNYNEDGRIYSRIEMIYDELGNQLKRISYDQDGKIVEYSDTTYDEYNNIHEVILYDLLGNVIEKSEFENLYLKKVR